MEYNKILLSLILVNGVSNVCLAFDVSNINTMVDKYGRVDSGNVLPRDEAIRLAREFADKGNVDASWISSILRTQFSLNATSDKMIGDKNSDVFTLVEFDAMKSLLNSVDRSTRQAAFDRLSGDVEEAKSAPAVVPSVVAMTLTPEQQSLKLRVNRGDSDVYYVDDLRDQFAILENPSLSVADRQKAADLIAVSQFVGWAQKNVNAKPLSRIAIDLNDSRGDGAATFTHLPFYEASNNDERKQLARIMVKNLGVDKNKSFNVSTGSLAVDWTAEKLARNIQKNTELADYISSL